MQIEDKSTVDVGELAIEIEQLVVGKSCRAIVVCTGDLARISPKHVAQSFIDNQCAPVV